MTSKGLIDRSRNRRQLVKAIGRGVSRFQEASYAFDEVAAQTLALNRSDLPCWSPYGDLDRDGHEKLAAGAHVQV